MPGSLRSPKAWTLREGAPLTDSPEDRVTAQELVTWLTKKNLDFKGLGILGIFLWGLTWIFVNDFGIPEAQHYWYFESNTSVLWECSVYCETLDGILSSSPLHSDHTRLSIPAVTPTLSPDIAYYSPEGQDDPPTLTVHHCSAWHLPPG